MANRLLIEIDTSEARVVLARRNGRHLEIADSFSVEFDPGALPADIARIIRDGLNKRSIPVRGDLDLIFTRRDIELREIVLPPAPDDELPEMVRFAARNEFTQFHDTTQMDFVPIQGDAEAQRKVIAATLNPGPSALAEEISSGLKMRIRRILVRPWCLAHSLPGEIGENSSALILDASGDAIEISLWSDGHVLLTRSFRPAGHDSDSRQNEIADEVQRTLMAAVRGTGGKPIEKIAILGQKENFPLPERKSFPPVVYFTPAAAGSGSGIGAAREVVFAAHRGALNRLESGVGDMLDFQNPRRALRKETDWKRVGLWGGAAALVLVICAVMAWSTLRSQSTKIASLQTQLAAMKKANEPTGNRPGIQQIVGEVQVVDNWLIQAVDWTRELQEISDRMLTPDDAIVNSIQLNITEDHARIALSGHMLDTNTGTDIKTRLNSRPYKFDQIGATRTDGNMDDYPSSFSYVLTRQTDRDAVLAELSQRALDARNENLDAAEGASGTGTPATSTADPPQ